MLNLYLILLGAVPLALGYFEELAITLWQVYIPHPLWAIAFLVLWGWAARQLCRRGAGPVRTVLLMNALPALALILLAVQLLVQNRYWPNLVGTLSQAFYTHLVGLGFTLTKSIRHASGPYMALFAPYAACFLLLVASAAIGCRKKKN